ncbi:MAG: hypothetical protein IPJ34_28215 [Myxococcales bacterium]|nr:hypothetical protein [Myxococcales bacterium]
MHIVRLVFALALGAVFVLVALGNSLGMLLALRRKRAEGSPGGVSFVPFLGGVAGALACVVAPVHGVARWAWLPLLVDFGCAPLLTWTAIATARRR